MRYTNLQKNLEALIRDRGCSITEAERRSGAKKNSLYNILSGASKKPSAEILQLYADFFGVTVKDLLAEDMNEQTYLSMEEIILLKEIVNYTAEESVKEKLNLTLVDFINIAKSSIDYAASSKEIKFDEKFTKWLLHQKATKD